MDVTSVFDVIDNFWGENPLEKILSAERTALEEFGTEVNRFYDSYLPPLPAPEDFRTYSGGFVAGNFSIVGKRQTFFNTLLYSHSALVPDPIARWYFDRYEVLAKLPAARYQYSSVSASVDQSEWLGWLLSSYRAFQWDVQICREVLRFFIVQIEPLRRLVQDGIVVLVSQAHILINASQVIVDGAVADAEDPEFVALCARPRDEQLPRWDNLRGGSMTPRIKEGAPSPATVRRADDLIEFLYHGV